jgi:hypothetical protein
MSPLRRYGCVFFLFISSIFTPNQHVKSTEIYVWYPGVPYYIYAYLIFLKYSTVAARRSS